MSVEATSRVVQLCCYIVFVLSYNYRLFAGFVARVLWISVGGFVFLGAYEKSKHLLLL